MMHPSQQALCHLLTCLMIGLQRVCDERRLQQRYVQALLAALNDRLLTFCPSIAGWCTAAFGVELDACEIKCLARGDNCCR